jgi:hypothetical protein
VSEGVRENEVCMTGWLMYLCVNDRDRGREANIFRIDFMVLHLLYIYIQTYIHT